MESSDDDSYAGSAASIDAERDRSDARVLSAVASAFDPLPLDRAMVVEAQHSGRLNAVSKDLLGLTREADALCARAPAQLSEMTALIKKTEANVEWLRSRTATLAQKAQARNPIEYAQAEARIVYREES